MQVTEITRGRGFGMYFEVYLQNMHCRMFIFQDFNVNKLNSNENWILCIFSSLLFENDFGYFWMWRGAFMLKTGNSIHVRGPESYLHSIQFVSPFHIYLLTTINSYLFILWNLGQFEGLKQLNFGHISNVTKIRPFQTCWNTIKLHHEDSFRTT